MLIIKEKKHLSKNSCLCHFVYLGRTITVVLPHSKFFSHNLAQEHYNKGRYINFTMLWFHLTNPVKTQKLISPKSRNIYFTEENFVGACLTLQPDHQSGSYEGYRRTDSCVSNSYLYQGNMILIHRCSCSDQ